jgi:hypothetical protein
VTDDTIGVLFGCLGLVVAVFGLIISNHEPTKKAVFGVKPSPDQNRELTPAEVVVIKSMVSAVLEKGETQGAGTTPNPEKINREAGTPSGRIPAPPQGELITPFPDPTTKSPTKPTSDASQTSIDPTTDDYFASQ